MPQVEENGAYQWTNTIIKKSVPSKRAVNFPSFTLKKYYISWFTIITQAKNEHQFNNFIITFVFRLCWYSLVRFIYKIINLYIIEALFSLMCLSWVIFYSALLIVLTSKKNFVVSYLYNLIQLIFSLVYSALR